MTQVAKDFDWPTNDLVYTLRDYTLIIAKWDYVKDKLTSLDSTELTVGDTIRIHYAKKSTRFTADLTASPSFPSEFHEAPMYRVLQQLHASKGNVQQALYYKAEYKECVMMAKKYKNRGKDDSNYSINQHSY
jgi:hypothetical protein|tara:strand:+ start:1658 stop:2053 length:396 start_codon:yes stop_codon:yes gene_type:complete